MLQLFFSVVVFAFFMIVILLSTRNRLGSCSSCHTHCKLKEL